MSYKYQYAGKYSGTYAVINWYVKQYHGYDVEFTCNNWFLPTQVLQTLFKTILITTWAACFLIYNFLVPTLVQQKFFFSYRSIGQGISIFMNNYRFYS